MSKLLNLTNTRAYALHVASSTRPAAGFTRISAEFLDRLEIKLKQTIYHEIHSQPSNGKTIK